MSAVIDDVMVEAGEVSATRQSPYPVQPECTEIEHCLRPPYDDDGRCKKHADEHRYAKMRELEQICRHGVWVRCLTNHQWFYGVAHSRVRLVPKDIPTRGRWPSVLVLIDGHNAPVEWPAIDVEVA